VAYRLLTEVLFCVDRNDYKKNWLHYWKIHQLEFT